MRTEGRKMSRSAQGVLPNLIIIGAQKCATTSLHYYLSLHPEICMSKEKELHFFVGEQNWDKGIKWYKSNFTGDAKIHGEASPGYTNYPRFRGVPQRMHAVVPGAKLIYLVRDPIERIISHYVHWYAEGREDRSLTEALQDFSHNEYLCRSRYYWQLEQYLAYFPQSTIYIMTREDLYAQRRRALQDVFRFLEVGSSFYRWEFVKMMHRSHYKRRKSPIGQRLAQTLGARLIASLHPRARGVVEKLIYFPFSNKIESPTLDPLLRQEVIDYLRGDINRLRAHTGRMFESWCV